jgi:alpha-1,6-mannosyltransferase
MTPELRSAADLHRHSTPQRPLRLVAAPALRVVDVAPFHGERSGAIRTYLEAKRDVLRADPDVDHHVVVPGPREHHDDGWHELPSLRVAALNATLTRLRPDVVLLHDPFWSASGIAEQVHTLGGRVVAVHHGSSALEAAGRPGPDRVWRQALRGRLRRACREVDAIMAADDAEPDCGRPAAIPLRFGVDAAFRPQPEVERRGHVLYAGRLAREKGVETLLDAAALSIDPWPLVLAGSGPLAGRLEARARRFGLEDRVILAGHVDSPAALARIYAAADCVVMPGAMETFGLVALEAAASGARVVACRSAPSARMLGDLVHTFAPDDAHGLARAIAAARLAPRDLGAAGALARRTTWEAAIAAELADLRLLARPVAPRMRAA